MTLALAEIMQLSITERIQLVEDIWDSISTAPESLPLTEAQRLELDRRSAAYREDPATVVPWSEARERIRNPA